jgi:hypothetical protein
LGGAIDVDEIGLHDADNFAGSGVSGNQRIQSLRFAAERDDKPASGVADFAGEGEEFFSCSFLLRMRRRKWREKREKAQKQGRERPAAKGLCSSVVHIRLPRVLLSILYVLRPSCNELAKPRYPRKNGTIARAGRYIHQYETKTLYC